MFVNGGLVPGHFLSLLLPSLLCNAILDNGNVLINLSKSLLASFISSTTSIYSSPVYASYMLSKYE